MIERPTDFEDLVRRTAGPQPWRRLLHTMTGVAVAAILSLSGITKGMAVLALTATAAALLLFDVIRLRSARLNELFFRVLRPLVTPREARRFASSTWYALGMLLAVALFPRVAAISGILVISVGDPAASYAGRRWGRRRFLGGTLEGSLVFLVASLCVLATRHPPHVALVAALVATLAERLAWPLDDNLVVPVVTAGAIVLLWAMT